MYVLLMCASFVQLRGNKLLRSSSPSSYHKRKAINYTLSNLGELFMHDDHQIVLFKIVDVELRVGKQWKFLLHDDHFLSHTLTGVFSLIEALLVTIKLTLIRERKNTK